MIYVQRSLSGSIVQKTLVFNSEEEFTAFENQRRKEFGKNWCLFDESDPSWDFCAQVYFNFINVKDPDEKYGKLEDLFAEFVLRHKQSLMFYHNLTCWEDKNGDHYGNIPELEKLTDEELFKKEIETILRKNSQIEKSQMTVKTKEELEFEEFWDDFFREMDKRSNKNIEATHQEEKEEKKIKTITFEESISRMKSLRDFDSVADFTDFGGVASPVERIAPDGSKDYVVTMNCGV